MRLRLNIYLKVSKCPVAGFIASLTGICQHTHVLTMDLPMAFCELLMNGMT